MVIEFYCLFSLSTCSKLGVFPAFCLSLQLGSPLCLEDFRGNNRYDLGFHVYVELEHLFFFFFFA